MENVEEQVIAQHWKKQAALARVKMFGATGERKKAPKYVKPPLVPYKREDELFAD